MTPLSLTDLIVKFNQAFITRTSGYSLGSANKLQLRDISDGVKFSNYAQFYPNFQISLILSLSYNELVLLRVASKWIPLINKVIALIDNATMLSKLQII